MSNLTRHIKRRNCQKLGIPWPKRPQFTILQPDGDYRTLHPTRGWMKVSGKRVKPLDSVGAHDDKKDK